MAAAFVGRAAEMASVLDAVAAGRTCLVTGAAGVGKSRLLHEVGQRLASDGSELLTISGTEATSIIPLAPLLRLCPPDVPDPGTAIIAELYRRSREREVTVICDDAHQLDEASAAVLVQISNADAFTLVVGIRTGEPAPSGVLSLVGADQTTSVAVEPLTRHHTLLLAQEMVGGRVASNTADWLWTRSLGHPLYLRELLVSADETGVLARRAGHWTITDPDIRSRRLRQMITHRLERLPGHTRTAVDVAALGIRLHHRVVEQVAGRRGIRDAVDRGLLEREGDRLVCTHPLYREVAASIMSSDEMTLMRSALADAVDHVPEVDPITRAMVLIDSDRPPGTPLLEAAYDAALDARRPHLAEEFAQQIRARHPDQAEPMMRLAVALAMQRRWVEATELYRGAVERAEGDLATSFHIRWLQANFDYQDNAIVVIEEANRVGDEVGGELGASLRYPALRGELFVGNLLDVSERFAHLLSRDETPDDIAVLAALDLATADGHTGHFDRSVRLTSELIDGRRGKLQEMEEARVRVIRTESLGWHESTLAALDSATDYVALARSRGDPDWETLACLSAGLVAIHAHRASEANEWISEALRVGVYGRHVRHIGLSLAEYARARSLLPGIDASVDVVKARGAAADNRIIGEAMIHLADSRVARQERSDPIPALEAGLRHAERRGTRTHELFILRELVICEDTIPGLTAEQVATRANEIASYSDTRGLAGIYADEIAAAAHRDPGASDAVGRAALEWGAIGVAIDAFGVAAINHASQGNSKAAFVSELSAEHASKQIPPQISWPLQRHTPVLTERESQVADLASEGLTSRGIAAALYISRRTVDSHLRRIYQRLDLSGREELTSLMAVGSSSE